MLKEAFEQHIPCRAAYESNDMSVALFLLSKYRKWKTLIIGDGDAVIVLRNYLKRVHDIDVEFVIRESDINIFDKQNKSSTEYNWIIFNLSKSYSNNAEYKRLFIQLLNHNIKTAYKVIDMSAYIYDLFYVSFVSFFLNNKKELIKNEDIWKDEKSKKIYVEYVSSFLEGRSYTGETLGESRKYFALDHTRFFEFAPNTSWINVGAASGDTVFWQFHNRLRFKNIYAIEGNADSVKVLEKNLQFVKDESVHILPYYCGTGEGEYRLDDINDNVSLINMDIEGAEKDALLSGKKLIIRCRPILAICVYHLADDLIEIPKLIRSMDKSYEFYLRKYVSGTGRHYHAVHKVNELVLYAIPGGEGSC